MNLKKIQEIPVILVDPVSSQAPEISERIAGTLEARLEASRSWLEAVSRLRRHGLGVALTYLPHDGDLSGARNFLSLLEGGLSKGQFYAILLTPQPESAALKQLGFQAIFNVREQDEVTAAVQSFLDKIAAEIGRTETGKHEIRWEASLGLRSDFWIFGGRAPKWVADRWVIKLLGPAPGAGSWVQLNSSTWRWQARQKNGGSPFMPEAGEWLFRGIFPRFEGESWIFSGPSPRLSFWSEGKELGVKFQEEASGCLVLAQDSENALSFLPEIESTLNQEKHIPGVSQGQDALNEQTVKEKETSSPKEGRREEASLLALSLLISELNLKKGLSSDERMRTVRSYLEWATQISAVEFWSQFDGQWKCLSVAPGSQGILLEQGLKGGRKSLKVGEKSLIIFDSAAHEIHWSEKFEREIDWIFQPFFLDP